MAQHTLLDPSELENIVRRIDALSAASPRQWGRMSVHQMTCHLSDGYRTAFGERTVPSYSTFKRRTVMKFIALHTPFPWPKGRVKTIPEADQEVGGTRPVEFTADIAELKRLVARFGTDAAKLGERPHSLFGPLTRSEWGVWGYKHADHHLRQFGV